MRVETREDIQLVMRAHQNGWRDVSAEFDEIAKLVHDPGVKPSLKIEAFQALVKYNEATVKKELAELKRLGDEQQLRLRLLELARLVKPDELARLASQNGIATGAAD